MKIKIIDQLHISEVQADTIPGGTTIEVSDSTGEDLVKRRLATKVAAAPKNKAAPAAQNKAGSRRK